MNLQTKFGFSYVLIIVVVLAIMNTYPILISQNLVFRSKETSLSSSVKVIESSLSNMETLSEESVSLALSNLKETGVSRLLITDVAGRILYDTRETGNAVGRYAFFTELVQALNGNDAFFCAYDAEAFLSRFAAPVIYHNQIIGAVYAYDYDVEQAELLKNLQQNLLRISGVVAVITIVLSFGLGRLLTSQISSLLAAMQKVKEGSYSARAKVTSKDEIGDIAEEFNRLTAQLESTEQARRRFVSDASHELKTPLAGIRLMTDSILQTENIDLDTTKDFVQDIGQEAERLTHITEDLLRISKMDSGIIQDNHPVQVKPVVARVLHMLSVVAKENQITLTSDVDEKAVILGSEDNLHQILYNLVENGVKYSPKGGFVHTNVSLANEKVIINVEDHGIGIPEEDRKHIFERFYRVDKDRSRSMGGTGLGLAIVKETVENMKGSIRVDARPGGGSIFTIEFPLEKEEKK